ncbi:MAG: hypothetical protein JZU47_02025 [Prolixibacteraceae bacterium]|nr:hypothetical protein [Prolixibacteraceae bacterium]
MNKHKLIQIIIKDLEELKTLTTEVAESESDSTLIIDLALSRARLLCQEIELLKEVSVKTETLIAEKEISEETEEESSDLSFSDPELEIINFEEREFPETEELHEEDEEEEVMYNSDEEEPEEEDLDEIEEEESSPEEELPKFDDEPDLVEEEELDMDQVEEEGEELENDDEEKIELEEEEEDLDAEDYELEEENEFETEDEETEQVTQTESTLQVNELKPDSHSGIREIQIEDLDEEETEPIQFTSASAPAGRPVMREIPKPEDAQKEKQVLGETFQKERSLNDAIGENKSVESNLGNGPISSLRSSIGLNDRFLFIREIFSNNTDKYNMVIDHLDKLETIQEAVDYLKANLTLQKNDTSLKFVDLLKRRFTK